ncbi:MAG: hypothetical protein LBU34_16885 [Planctomycetaceae bacterium]|nr:hypothetical protein [Planctomycetaceae bacterium]
MGFIFRREKPENGGGIVLIVPELMFEAVSGFLSTSSEHKEGGIVS